MGNLENQSYLFWTQEVTWHLNIGPTFLLYVITNEKIVKLMQIDRLLSTSRLLQKHIMQVFYIYIKCLKIFIDINSTISFSYSWHRGRISLSELLCFIYVG